MTEPREALQPDERELARLNHSGTHSCRGLCPGRFLVALEAAEARLAAGVHLGDEGRSEGPGLDALRADLDDAIDLLLAQRNSATLVVLQRLRAALAAQENPAPARSAPSLDEGLLALALYEVDGFGLLSECRETARDIASVYRRLAQEGETP